MDKRFEINSSPADVVPTTPETLGVLARMVRVLERETGCTTDRFDAVLAAVATRGRYWEDPDTVTPCPVCARPMANKYVMSHDHGLFSPDGCAVTGDSMMMRQGDMQITWQRSYGATYIRLTSADYPCFVVAHFSAKEGVLPSLRLFDETVTQDGGDLLLVAPLRLVDARAEW